MNRPFSFVRWFPKNNSLVPTLCVGMQSGRSASPFHDAERLAGHSTQSVERGILKIWQH